MKIASLQKLIDLYLVKWTVHLVNNEELILKCCYFAVSNGRNMKQQHYFKILTGILLLFFSCITVKPFAQEKSVNDQFKRASNKVEKGLENNNKDTLAQGYFDLGETYHLKGDFQKSEGFYQKAKDLFTKLSDAEGVAKSSRALAIVQEELHKNKDAIDNFIQAQKSNDKIGNTNNSILNSNDQKRLSNPGTAAQKQQMSLQNINLGRKLKDTAEIVQGLVTYVNAGTYMPADTIAVNYKDAYNLSRVNHPEQAIKFNQLITDAYLKDKKYDQAIATKKELLNEPFVQNSTQTTVQEITTLAGIYIKNNNIDTATKLLKESYSISVQHNHTLEARKCLEQLDSIYQSSGRAALSLQLYKDFLTQLPLMIEKDSSLIDDRIIAETEQRIKILESEKALKDNLIKKKNTLNYWLLGSIAILLMLMAVILYILRKLKRKNKKIALQSLRREMNPHFIFNSLNSINQFIANNNELEANQYLARFSTLMRNVMENSKNDFVLFSSELKLLENYLELEKSRFPDKFDFKIETDDALNAEEQLYIPGMLVQPHLENAIWHGLRYMDAKGFLKLSFNRKQDHIEISIEDNGIGIEGSKKSKTANQKQHNGRGISNTLERINILNELYRQHITCNIADKIAPDHGVTVKISVPLLKNIQHED